MRGRFPSVAALLPAKRIDCSSRRVRERQTARPAVVCSCCSGCHWTQAPRWSKANAVGAEARVHFRSHGQVSIKHRAMGELGYGRRDRAIRHRWLAGSNSAALTLHKTKTRRTTTRPIITTRTADTLFCLTPCLQKRGCLLPLGLVIELSMRPDGVRMATVCRLRPPHGLAEPGHRRLVAIVTSATSWRVGRRACQDMPSPARRESCNCKRTVQSVTLT